MDEKTKLDKTTVTGVLEKPLNTINDVLEKIRNAAKEALDSFETKEQTEDRILQ